MEIAQALLTVLTGVVCGIIFIFVQEWSSQYLHDQQQAQPQPKAPTTLTAWQDHSNVFADPPLMFWKPTADKVGLDSKLKIDFAGQCDIGVQTPSIAIRFKSAWCRFVALARELHYRQYVARTQQSSRRRKKVNKALVEKSSIDNKNKNQNQRSHHPTQLPDRQTHWPSM